MCIFIYFISVLFFFFKSPGGYFIFVFFLFPFLSWYFFFVFVSFLFLNSMVLFFLFSLFFLKGSPPSCFSLFFGPASPSTKLFISPFSPCSFVLFFCSFSFSFSVSLFFIYSKRRRLLCVLVCVHISGARKRVVYSRPKTILESELMT